MKNKNVRRMVFCGLVAAVYVVVTTLLAPICFGPIQCRVSEALTMFAILCPEAVWAVTLGCFVSNWIGVFMGTNIIGVFDVLFGTLATLIAGIISYKTRNVRIKNIPWAAALAPIIANGLVVGAELAFVLAAPGTFMPVFAVNAFQVALGEAVAVIVIGIPVTLHLEKMNIINKIGL